MNPYPEGSPEWLLYEIFGEQPQDGESTADEALGWPASEYFQPDPSPYTLSALRSYRDARGETHYY